MGDKSASSPIVVAESGEAAVVSSGTPKKGAIAKSAKPCVKPTHPKTADMVNTAILSLKERGGSSLQAIKKYMAVTYKIDTEKQATFIRKYLKSAVASGILIQTKGKGAAGSFKLPSAKVDPAKTKSKPAIKAKAPKKAPVAKKPATAKKPSAASVKKAPAKKAASAVSPKRKATKGPAAKPPKAKTTKAKPVAKTPVKKSKSIVAKKTKSVAVAAKTKKAAASPKKAVATKK